MNHIVKKLYSNIGNKVCKVAVACGYVGIVCAIIGVVAFVIGLADGDEMLLICGGIAAVLGLCCFVSSWPLYAFGQITNDVHAMREDGAAVPVAQPYVTAAETGERFTRRYTLPKQPVREDLQTPVEVVAGALMLSNHSGNVLAQVKYRNISKKSIKSITVDVAATDSRGARISGVEGYVYESLIAAPGDAFGDKRPIKMSDSNAHAFSVDVVAVEFSDGTSWSKRGRERVNAAREAGAQAVENVKQVPKAVVKIPLLIVNILFFFVMLGGVLFIIEEFIIAPSLQLFIAMVLAGAATLLSMPGFQRLLFRNGYGMTERLIRWSTVAGIYILDVLIMEYFFV